MDTGSQGALPDSAAQVENLYRVIAHELPHGAVFVVDRDLRYVLADGAELKMAGFTPADFEGRTVRETAPPGMVAQYEQDYLTVLAGGTFSREHEVNGRCFRSYGMPLKNGQGEAELALAVSYDITERVQAERKLNVLSELGTMAQAATSCDMIIDHVADLLGRYLGPVKCFVADVTPATGDLVELSGLLQQHRLPGPHPIALLGEACGAALRLGRTAVAPSNQPGSADCVFLQALGMRSFVLIPRMRGGGLAGLFAVGRPVKRGWPAVDLALAHTVAERTWEAIDRCRALDALQASDRHKNRILALLGHELRNPISALKTGLGLLKPPPQDTATHNLVKVLERQVDQINRLVQDLLGVSYVFFGKLELRLDDLAFDEVVGAVVDTLRPAAERKRQQLLYTPPGRPLHLTGDRTKLTQVLTNLVNNAVKYTPEGGRIAVDLGEDGDDLVLRIEDDGIGMEAEVQAHLFELFVRGSDHRGIDDVTETGLGIGLWIVKQFVDAHHGEIGVRSAGRGLGSVFDLRLPRAGTGGG